MTALLALSPIQRFRRIRRLLQELQGQTAVMRHPLTGRETRAAADRMVEATEAIIAEMQILEDAGVMSALEECFLAIFGADARPEKPHETYL